MSIDGRRADNQDRFWVSYIRRTLIVIGAMSIGILVYLHLSPSGPHRLTLQVIVSIVAAVVLGTVPFVGSIAAHLWRSRFALVGGLACGVLLAVCCYLDYGIGSPLVFFLAIPVANAALGLRTRAVALCGAAALAEFVTVAIAGPKAVTPADDLVIVATFLGGMLTLSLGWALNRSRLQRDEDVLLANVVRLATTDTLTGCLNHGSFFQRLDDETCRAVRHNEPLSLLLADVDHFKQFNDAHGHPAGDDGLATIGRVLRDSSRSFDIVGRIGGDEFAVILPGTAVTDARSIAHRMSNALNNPDDLPLTVTAGVAALDPNEPTAQRLYRDADAALYRSKRHRTASPSPPDGSA
jgi:diguanylate cyclase (GGDEF)-like protein